MTISLHLACVFTATEKKIVEFGDATAETLFFNFRQSCHKEIGGGGKLFFHTFEMFSEFGEELDPYLAAVFGILFSFKDIFSVILNSRPTTADCSLFEKILFSPE